MSQTGSHVPDPSEIFVGREAELARLADAFEQAVAGAGSVTLVAGDPGTGKSTLIREFVRRARQRESSWTFCRGRCAAQFGPGEAYLPFLEGLDGLLMSPAHDRTADLLRQYAPTWCQELPAAAVPPEALRQRTFGATKERMLREFGDLFEAASGQAPLVGVLEDVHWADPSSVDLLRHLANRIPKLRMLIVASYRPSNLGLSNPPVNALLVNLRLAKRCHEIALGPLNRNDVGRYLELRFASKRLPEGLAEAIESRTEGHPLFVASLAQYLLDRGHVVMGPGGAYALAHPISESDFEAPENVRALIRSIVESLPEADRSALQHASVMGREFLSTFLARLLEGEELKVEECLGRLARSHRLVYALGEEELPDGSLATRYRFANAVYQEVLYEDILSQRRIGLHRKLGELMASCYGTDAGRVAYALALHFERGRDFEAAVRQLIQAGDNAARLYAHGEAEEYYRRALELLERLPEGQRAERATTLHQKLGAVRLAMGRFDDAGRSYARMHDAAQASDAPALECAALIGLCNTLFYAQRFDEMALRAEAALRAADRSGSEPLRAETLLLIAQIVQEGGNLGDCRALLDEALATARRLDHRPSLLLASAYRGVLHYWQSEYAPAEECLAEAMTLAADLRDGFRWLMALRFLGLARGNQGRISDALDSFEEGSRAARRNGDHHWLPTFESHIGWIHRELQDFDGAVAHDSAGLAIARENHVNEAEAGALLNLGIAETQFGSVERAAAFLDQARAASRPTLFAWFFDIRLEAALAEHALRARDLVGARRHAERLLEAATRQQAATYVVSARTLLGEVALAEGALARADACLADAIAQLAGRFVPLVAWRAHAAQGRVKAALGDTAASALAFDRAALVVRGIAASVGDEALRAGFLASPPVREILQGAHPQAA